MRDYTDITEFIKYLVELGGVFHVDEKYRLNVLTVDENEEVVKLPQKVKESPDSPELPIVIFHQDREPGEYHLLSPFKANASTNIANEIFFCGFESHIAQIIKDLLLEITEVTTDEDKLKKIMSTFGTLSKDPDATLKKEIESINLVHFMEFHYDIAKKTIRAVSRLEDAQIREEYKKPNIRKKSWDLITGLFTEIMRETPILCPKTYVYTSTGVGIPKTECYLKLYNLMLKHLEPLCKDFLGISFNLNIFDEHLPYINEYRRMVLPDDGIKKINKELVNCNSDRVTSQSGSSIPRPMSMRSRVPRVSITNDGRILPDRDYDDRTPNIPPPNSARQFFRSTRIVESDRNERSRFRLRLS